jgi:hypothetical protein
MGQRFEVTFTGTIPDGKPKLPGHITALSDEACGALVARLVELGLTGVTFRARVVRPKADKLPPEPAAAPVVEHPRKRSEAP